MHHYRVHLFGSYTHNWNNINFNRKPDIRNLLSKVVEPRTPHNFNRYFYGWTIKMKYNPQKTYLECAVTEVAVKALVRVRVRVKVRVRVSWLVDKMIFLKTLKFIWAREVSLYIISILTVFGIIQWNILNLLSEIMADPGLFETGDAHFNVR